MYALDGSYRFSIYWSDNLLLVFDFDYDKMNALEVRSLVVSNAFQVVKVKDLLHMAEDSEQFYNFSGNAYMQFLLLLNNLINPHVFFYFFLCLPLLEKMANVNLFDQKKLMVEAIIRCGDQ